MAKDINEKVLDLQINLKQLQIELRKIAESGGVSTKEFEKLKGKFEALLKSAIGLESSFNRSFGQTKDLETYKQRLQQLVTALNSIKTANNQIDTEVKKQIDEQAQKRKKRLKEEQALLRSSIKEGNARRTAALNEFEARQKSFRDKRKAREREVERQITEFLKKEERKRTRIAEAEEKKRDFKGGFAGQLTPRAIGGALGSLTKYLGLYQAINAAQRVFRELTLGSVREAVAFEKALANLSAVAGATEEEVSILSETALKVAGSTKFTAEEIVGLQTELSKLGFSAEDVVSATQGIAFTAQALGAPLEAVAQQTGKVINQFDLLIEQAGFVGDVLVTSINNSALSFDSFGTAIQYVGPIAKNLGLSLEQTAGAMAVLADNGFTASRIGTGLRGIFTELGKTSADVETSLKALAEENISLSEAVDLVGKRNAAQLITLLKNIDALDESNDKYYEQGRALQSAAKQVDNFSGQMDLLNSAFKEFQISIGESISNSNILLSVLDAFFPAAGKTARGFQAINEVGFDAFNQGAKEVESGANALNKSLELLGISQEEYQRSLDRLNVTETSFVDYLPEGFSKIGDAALAQVQKVDGFRMKLEEVAEESRKQTLISEGQKIATDEYEESVRRLTQAFEDQINVNDEVDDTAARINSQIEQYNAIIATGIKTETDAFGIKSQMVEVTEDEILKYKGLVGALQGYLDQLTNVTFSEEDLAKKRKKEREKAVRDEKSRLKDEIDAIKDNTAEQIASVNERAKVETEIAETAEERAAIEAERAKIVSDLYLEQANSIGALSRIYTENEELILKNVKASEKLSAVLGSDVIDDINKAYSDYSNELEALQKAQEDGTISQEDYERSVGELRARLVSTIATFREMFGTSPEMEQFFDNILLNFDSLTHKLDETEEKTDKVAKTMDEFFKEFKEGGYLEYVEELFGAIGESLDEFNKTATENTKNELESQLDSIKNRYEVEQDIIKSQLDNQLITESQYRKKQLDLRKAQLAEENSINQEIFEAEKKQDINDAKIDGLVAAAKATIKAIEKYGPTPAGFIAAAIGTGIVAGQTGAQVAAINQRKFFPKKFEDGGMVSGPSHAEGGVPFSVQGRGGYEMEGGEYIVNKRATARHRDLLERINKTGISTPVQGKRKFALGGFVGTITGLASVDYLKAIAENTEKSANNTQKPVRAYVADKDLRSNDTERRLRDRNDRI